MPLTKEELATTVVRFRKPSGRYRAGDVAGVPKVDADFYIQKTIAEAVDLEEEKRRQAAHLRRQFPNGLAEEYVDCGMTLGEEAAPAPKKRGPGRPRKEAPPMTADPEKD